MARHVMLSRVPLAAPPVNSQVLLRHSTVGAYLPSGVSGGTQGYNGYNGLLIQGTIPIPGLVEFLQRLSLMAYFEPVKRWSEEQGACDVMELVENADELANAVLLPPGKREELKNGAAVAKAISEACRSRKLKKALSTPVTQKETQTAHVQRTQATQAAEAGQAARLGMVLLHTALAPVREGPFDTNMDRTETDLWDEKEAAAHAVAIEDPCLSYGCEQPERGSQKQDRYWRLNIEPHLLRQRNPTQAEIEVKDRAIKAAREEILAEWGPDETSSSSVQPKHAAFEEMRQQFLENYEGNIHAELGKGYKLTPTEVAPSVKEKFVQEQKETAVAPDYGYHGTRVANIPSILTTGLKVPGATSGVRVANGSAHGVGIYTGMPGNLWISKGFSDSPNMLICGVLDPDAPARPQIPVASSSGSRVFAQPSNPRLKSGHRNHHKPAAAPVSAAAPAPVYACTEFRKTDEIKVVGAARVIFKEERVAPLFIAQPVSSTESFSHHAVQAGQSSRGGSKGQVYVQDTGEVIWDCWEEARSTEARRLKRKQVAKDRQHERSSLRLLKRTEQETDAFGD